MLTDELIRGQAQHLIGALLAHNFVPKTLPEELYVKLWDVVMAQLKCVNHEGARAIESAATAPLLARIAELTRELEEARKDAMNAAALICDALPAPPSCNVLERNLWDVATVAAADAIRAAIKEQT